MTNNRNMIGNFRDLSALGISNVISSVIGGIFWLFLAGLIGAEKYGEISYVIAVASIAATLSFIGSSNTLIVFTAKGEKIQAPIMFISIVGSSIASIILFLTINDFGGSVYVIGFVVFGLISSELLGRKLYKKYAVYIITQRLLMVSLGILFYLFIGIDGIVLGIGVSFLPYAFKLIQIFKCSKLDFTLLQNKRNFILNSYVLDLRSVFYGSVDKVIILPLLGFTLLGNYQLGMQIFMVLTILPTVVFQYMVPQDSSGKTNSKLKFLTVIISVCFSGISILLAPIILPILFSEFTNTIQVVQIISLAVVPSTIVLMYLSRFLGDEKNMIMLVGTIIFITIQISGIIIMSTTYGVNGVAAAVVLAFTSEAIYFVIVDKLRKK